MPPQFNLEAVTAGLPGWLPRERRLCRGCRRAMRPVVRWRPPLAGEAAVARRGTFRAVPEAVVGYGYGPHGLFCSLRCAYRYACRHALAAPTPGT